MNQTLRNEKGKPLRFAPLVRVSTEKQEHQGESLRTQKAQIKSAVENIEGGILIDDPWKYTGQEHATESFERNKLDALLRDAAKGDFDAVMVCDASRWSRDNLKSEEGLRFLQKHKIRFFVLQSEYDLNNPAARMFLGVSAVINQFYAKEQNRKSILNRIARAKRGIPTSGKLPYGRKFDRAKEKWEVDEDKRKSIVWAAEQYLNGKQLPELAKVLGMNASNLWKILTKRSGDTWVIRYRSKELNIDKPVPFTNIPRLLPQETINRILKRAASNKTYHHGMIKHKYLLSRMVFCDHCGYAMFGQTNLHGNKNRYYRHARDRRKECNKGFWFRADDLERAVLLRLFALVGDPVGLKKAMERAIPDSTKIDELLSQKESLENQLVKVESERQRLVKAVSQGVFDLDDISNTMDDIKNRKAALTKAINHIDNQTKGVPTKAQIERKAKHIDRVLGEIYCQPKRIFEMTFSEKRKLVQSFFDGHSNDGKRFGVYVRKTPNGTQYTIKGVLGAFDGLLKPNGISPFELAENGLSIEYAEDLTRAVYGQQNEKDQDLLQERHAHYRIGLHQ